MYVTKMSSSFPPNLDRELLHSRLGIQPMQQHKIVASPTIFKNHFLKIQKTKSDQLVYKAYETLCLDENTELQDLVLGYDINTDF